MHWHKVISDLKRKKDITVVTSILYYDGHKYYFENDTSIYKSKLNNVGYCKKYKESPNDYYQYLEPGLMNKRFWEIMQGITQGKCGEGIDKLRLSYA